VSQPERLTLREACVFAIAILGGTPSSPDIHRFLALDGWPASKASVRSTLYYLRGAAVEITAQGEPGHGRPTRWRLTEAARAWLAAGDPDAGS
jgi:hypothetical protein